MRTYQKIIILNLLLIGGALFYAEKTEEVNAGVKNILKKANLLTVCDEALYYSLGEVDPRFGISQEELLMILAEAENVWERDLNKNVFQYQEGSEFKINFIFDERQQGTIEKGNLDSQLDQLDAHKEDISEEYKEIEIKYEKEVVAYEKNVKNYEARVNDFNEEVDDWNKKGGASKDVFEELNKEEEELEKIRIQLETQRKNINKMVVQMNNLASAENKIVNTYNSQIETYKERFGESREFNQGEYIGVAINIYQFYEKNDLTLALAHEFGHALEVNHVENPESIMYYLMEKQDLENMGLTSEDLGAIKNICKIE